MPLFYYQIKASKKDEYGVGWSWPPVWQDVIEADDKKSAKEIIDKEYQRVFKLRVLKKDLDTGMFLLNIKEIREGDYTHAKLLTKNVCEQCGRTFTILEKYQINDGFYSPRHCSKECRDQNMDFEIIDNGNAVPVIYRITNRKTKMCYIGQTIQPFTLRWWQHFSKSNISSAKFRTEIERSELTDWIFEIVEVSKCKADLNSLESKHIRMNDSISNGYNTMSVSEGIKRIN